MMKLKKINHKIVAMSIGIGVSLASILFANKYISYNNEIAELNQQIENYKSQFAVLNNSLITRTGKLIASNTDLSYYAGNIYTYSLLEDFQVEIKIGESKYSNTISINLVFPEFKEKEKFKNFLQSLSYLGYIENVTKNSLSLHVTKFTIDDAKKLINSSNNKE